MWDLLNFETYAAPAFILVTSIPVVWKFVENIRQPRQVKSEGLYGDRDGKATEESMAAYSTKKQFTVIFVGLGVGLLASLTLMVDTFAQLMKFHTPELILITFWCWVSHFRLQRMVMCSHNVDHVTHSGLGCIPRDPHCAPVSARHFGFVLIHFPYCPYRNYSL